jgi:hypothetical protein
MNTKPKNCTLILLAAIFIFSENVSKAQSQQTGAGSSSNSPSASGGGSSGPVVGASMLAYQAQDEIGQQIACNIIKGLAKGSNGSGGIIKNVFITTTAPNANGTMFLYRGIISALETFESGFQNAINDLNPPDTIQPMVDPGVVFSAISNVMSIVPQTLGLISTTTTMGSVSVPTNELAVIPSIIKGLNNNTNGISCEYVDFFANTDYVTNTNSLFSHFLVALTNWGCSQALANQYIYITNGMIVFTNVPDDNTNALQTLIALNSSFGMFMTNVLATNFNSLLIPDFYQCNVRGHPTNCLLVVKSLFAGGDNRTKSNPLWNLFTDGPRYSYLGGTTVAYFVINSEGNIKLSDTIRHFVGYKKVPLNWFWVPEMEDNLKNKQSR